MFKHLIVALPKQKLFVFSVALFTSGLQKALLKLIVVVVVIFSLFVF